MLVDQTEMVESAPGEVQVNESTGVVYKKLQGTYFVNIDGRTIVCSITNRLRKRLLYPISDPAGGRLRTTLTRNAAVFRRFPPLTGISTGRIVTLANSYYTARGRRKPCKNLFASDG